MQINQGYKTTEFWLSLLGVALTGLVLYGVLTQEDADTILALVQNALLGTGGVIAIAAIVRNYVSMRTELKLKGA